VVAGRAPTAARPGGHPRPLPSKSPRPRGRAACATACFFPHPV
jgi:hypothetical protein